MIPITSRIHILASMLSPLVYCDLTLNNYYVLCNVINTMYNMMHATCSTYVMSMHAPISEENKECDTNNIIIM